MWGTRAAGRQLAQQASELGYYVTAYCSSSKSSQIRQIDNLDVISPEKLKKLYYEKEIDTVLLGVKNPSYRKEIEEIVSQMPPLDFSVMCAQTDCVENEYLKRAGETLQYRWEVPFEKQMELWLENFMGEVKSWVSDDAKANGIYHNVYLQRLKNKSFLGIDTTCQELAKTLHSGSIVMDIGCGLASLYGTILPNSEQIQLLAVDPLAPFYNKINRKYAGGEETVCQFGLFEFIADFYDENICDAILINNALDHCIDPYKSILECLYVLKCGGVMRLKHRRAEAVYEAYQGLHKWNVDVKNRNDLILWNQKNAVNVSEQLMEVAEIDVVSVDEDAPRASQMIIAEITKKRNFQLEEFFDMSQERHQLAYLTEGLMRWIAENNDEYLGEV